MSGTIRSRTEARKAAHSPGPSILREERCAYCSRAWPCPDRVAADDTLTDLNNAPLVGHRHREVLRHPTQHYLHEETFGDDRLACRLIPDPGSRDWPMPKPPPYPADDEGDE